MKWYIAKLISFLTACIQMRMALCFSMQSLDYERKEREFKNF
jgi:hypothetical protein